MVLAACQGCHSTSAPAPERGRSETATAPTARATGDGVSSPLTTPPLAGVASSLTTPPAAGVASSLTTPPAAGVPSEHGRAFDAGAMSCRVVRGPVPLPRRGPANLSVRGDTIEVLQNEGGRPRLTTLEAGPLTASPSASIPRRTSAEGGVVSVTDSAPASGSAVACARAGDAAFCPDPSGIVRRVALQSALPGRGQVLDAVVASSRSGSRVAAGMLGAHTALAYLASRTTSEGWLSEAWLAVDDDPPMRLSEEGSGATSLALARYGGGLLALTVDARVALTALHARVIANDARTRPRLGEDTVVFVGGPGDRRSGAEAVFPAVGPGWALLPIARDIGTFGLAVVRLDRPPRVDEPVVWSMYANGLDPASLAAVAPAEASATSSAEGLTWVARIVPRGPEPSAPRVLELGEVDSQGAFLVKGIVGAADNPGDVAVAIDSWHAIWVAWVDPKGAWIERLICR